MKFNLFKSDSKLPFPRCEHRSPSGRQCSQPVCSADPRFCGTHKPTPEQLAAVELAEAAGTLSSPEEVHRFLKTVLLNRVRGRITPKEASVYSYLCQNLLRSLREIDHFHELQSEREERNRPRPELLWHLPRPDRSDPPAPIEQIPESSVANSTLDATLAPSPVAANSIPAQCTVSAKSAAPIPAALSSSESFTSSTSSTSLTSKTLLPPFDPRHFYPFDPTLKRSSQDPNRTIPPPDEAECRRLAARRGLLFNRRPSTPGALR
jgi:hypothetical protein